MTSGNHPGYNVNAPIIPLSRRTMLKTAGAFALTWAGISARSRAVLAAPVVAVAAPAIDRIDECLASYSIRVTLADAAPGARYEAFGDLLEWDEDIGASDFCGTIPASPVVSRGEETEILLEGQVLATDLGLVKGLGPASDETFSPDLVELFARIWLRELDTSERYGPWDSPRRVAVTLEQRAWQIGRYPGSEFVIASRRGLAHAGDPVEMPISPRKCGR